MSRYLVTGTDTDVGKTCVVAALAKKLKSSGEDPLIVKIVQTGYEHDAQRAGTLANCRYLELARFAKPADPWSAALAENKPPLRAEDLAQKLTALPGPLIAEGAGGLSVPLNAEQTFAHVAVLAGLPIVLTIGLRLGCLNHALLTLALCENMHIPVAGAVLVERWGPVAPEYHADIERTLQGKVEILWRLPFEPHVSARDSF